MMTEVDKNHRLEEEPFTYQALKDGRVFLYFEDRHIKTIVGKTAEKFLAQVEEADDFEAQLVMAKITGNFKRGNERPKKKEA